MGKKPLQIPWRNLLSDRERQEGREAEIPSEEPNFSSCMTDQELADGIERHHKHLSSDVALKLPDGGSKLKMRLKMMEEERDRRQNLVCSVSEKDGEKCKDGGRPKRRKSPGSFGSRFSELLEKKVTSRNHEAHRKELSVMCKDGSSDVGRLGWKKHKSKGSSRSSPFRSPRGVTSRDRRKSGGIKPQGIGVFGGSFLQQEKGCTSYFSERRKSPEKSLNCNPMKVQDVVLLDEEAQQVDQPRKGEETDDGLLSIKEKKVYFPSRDHPECVELCHSDLKCLEPESYLSSNIMNFYILYIQREMSSSGKPNEEYHFCNTYFYRKLEEATSKKGEIRKHLTKLRRWWKGVNIFEKSYIFLPIHGDLHWSLVIICIPAKQDQFGPIVLHLDSLRFHSSAQILDNVERYLKEEWAYLEETTPQDLPISKRPWLNLPKMIEKTRIAVPQQKNDYDCGLFVLYFMERFIEAAPARLSREDLAMFGKKWFDPEEASGMRQRLRDLLQQLVQDSSQPGEGER
ncbi:ubiquitin-like-specific protease 1D [Wolffia australiana]